MIFLFMCKTIQAAMKKKMLDQLCLWVLIGSSTSSSFEWQPPHVPLFVSWQDKRGQTGGSGVQV